MGLKEFSVKILGSEALLLNESDSTSGKEVSQFLLADDTALVEDTEDKLRSLNT